MGITYTLPKPLALNTWFMFEKNIFIMDSMDERVFSIVKVDAQKLDRL
jgi:hypothetical protein